MYDTRPEPNMFILPYNTRLWSKIPVAKILLQHKQLLPHDTSSPMHGHKHSKSLGRMFFNHTSISSLDEVQRHKISVEPCFCMRHPDIAAPYIPTGAHHVMTMSDGLLRNTNLEKCWTICGTKHRFIDDERMSEQLKDTMKAHTRAAVSRTKNLMSENTNIHYGYEGWASSLLTDINAHIDDIPSGADPIECLPLQFRNNISSLQPSDIRRLRQLQSDFCIYRVDKNSGAFSLICLRGYLEGCSHSLKSQAYELQDVIHDSHDLMKRKFNIAQHDSMSTYSELPKLHKRIQPAMRPLVNSHATTNTKLSQNLTMAFLYKLGNSHIRRIIAHPPAYIRACDSIRVLYGV